FADEMYERRHHTRIRSAAILRQSPHGLIGFDQDGLPWLHESMHSAQTLDCFLNEFRNSFRVDAAIGGSGDGHGCPVREWRTFAHDVLAFRPEPVFGGRRSASLENRQLAGAWEQGLRSKLRQKFLVSRSHRPGAPLK